MSHMPCMHGLRSPGNEGWHAGEVHAQHRDVRRDSAISHPTQKPEVKDRCREAPTLWLVGFRPWS